MNHQDHEDHDSSTEHEARSPEVAGADSLSPASVPSGQVVDEPCDDDAGEDAADVETPSPRRDVPTALLAGIAGGVIGALIATGLLVVVDEGTSSPTLGASNEVFARPSSEVPRKGDLAAILAADVPAVVAVVADGGPSIGGAAGTGFVISEDGVVVTNNHVVEGASRIEARFSDGTSMQARVLGTDAASDLAVLHVDGAGLPIVELGNSDAVQVGDDVVAIGNALALEGGLSVTRGIVSGLHRTVPTSRSTSLVDVIQTDAAINPGNSGGPLVDFRGRVIGINTAIANPTSAQNVGFAIPISQAKPIIDALRAGNRPAYLGVTVDTAAKVAGAKVMSVAPNSPASRGGIEVGDVIIRFGGRAVTSWEQLRPAIRANPVGSSADVVVSRDGDDVTLRVTLEEDPGAS
ncbi:MAG: trypsin-like peptidase domain-containing protein [Acidimicrobiia bacterium]